MKRCPECRRDYYDDTLSFCLEDGTPLVQGSVPVGRMSDDEPVTAILSEPGAARLSGSTELTEVSPNAVATGFLGGEDQTRQQIHTTDQTAIFPRGAEAEPQNHLGDSSEKQSFSAHRAAKPQGKGGSWQRRLAVVGIAVIILVGGFFGYRYFGSNTKQIESIAVMPFVNESGNPDVEYLSDGMTETLIKSLSQLPNLSVKGRSSVFRYKGREPDAKTVGKELGVQAVLYGRIVQRGDQLSLSLELLDAATENVIWSDKYVRRQSDLVSLQSEIARDVSSKLKSKLSGADTAKVEKNYTANAEAYQLYLKGRFYWNKRTAESLKQAVEFFNQAVEKDPNYALAYSGLAETYVLFPPYSVALPQDSMPKAKAAAVRALEIDDSLAEAHTALGIYLSNFSWNQSAAEKEFRRAIELNPNYPNAHHQFGAECLSAMGRFDEAIAEGRRAEELDPLSPIIGADLGRSFTFARRFDEAIEQLKRTLTLDPNFYYTHAQMGMVYHASGQYAEAVVWYRKAVALGDDPWTKARLARSLARSGQRDEAVKLLGELQSESARRYVSSASLALVYGALGDKDKAFALLEKEVAERTQRPTTFSVNPLWDDLRDDPRFADLVRRVEMSKMD